MTALVLSGLVLAVLTILLGYLVVAFVRMAIHEVSSLPARAGPPLKGEIPEEQWTALDDQQVARFLGQSPP